MYHSKLCYISYVPQFEPLILGVKMLHLLMCMYSDFTVRASSCSDINVTRTYVYTAKASCMWILVITGCISTLAQTTCNMCGRICII